MKPIKKQEARRREEEDKVYKPRSGKVQPRSDHSLFVVDMEPISGLGGLKNKKKVQETTTSRSSNTKDAAGGSYITGRQQKVYRPNSVRKRVVQKQPEPKPEPAPRAPFHGNIVARRGDIALYGHGVDISETGIFVATDNHIFEVGDRFEIFVSPRGMGQSFTAIVEAARINTDPSSPVGYGLKFLEA